MATEIGNKTSFNIASLASSSASQLQSAGGVLGQIGSLVARLAQNEREVDAAQALRFSVFVEEMKAKVPDHAMRRRRDVDAWDDICDHLLVLDTSIEGDPEDQVVGTYRLLCQDKADAHNGFYTASEFDVSSLRQRHKAKRFMEIGRSCVLPAYRSRRTVELLWQGSWAYALANGIDAMIGCASFSGTNLEDHAAALSFLHHNAKTRGDWQAQALPQLYQNMDLLAADKIDARSAISSMPPLIKAYLRLGAMFGEGAVIDHAFNTTDVLVVLPIDAIDERYINYYSAGLSKTAA